MNQIELMLKAVQDAFARGVKPLADRIKALEERKPEKGEKGDAGDHGAAGRDGVDGKDGTVGPDGQRGEKGDPGERGEPGERGADGAAGRDGIDGKDGAPGKDGADGKGGERGERGEKGEPGIHGKDGADGQKGIDGIDGRDGLQGEPGRDAAHIDVLDGIDAEKRYQRGTYASFKGGIVRSFRQTDPLGDGAELEKSGWQIVVRGIAECHIAVGEDARSLSLRVTYTDGAASEKTIAVPTMIYRNIWTEREYQPGDTVTWGGSLWHCNEATKDKPGEGKAWTLAAKRGRDGKDAAPIESRAAQTVKLQ